LLLAGFDRADIDVIVGGRFARERLGGVHVSVEELPEVPGIPRQAFFAREDLVEVWVLALAILIFIGAAAAAWIVIVLRGSLVWAGVAAAVGALAAGGIGALIARAFARKPARELAAQLAARDLVLCVRVRSPEEEAKAQDILIGHGAEAVRLHEIQIEKRLEHLPLHSLRADPWLGEEPLTRRNCKNAEAALASQQQVEDPLRAPALLARRIFHVHIDDLEHIGKPHLDFLAVGLDAMVKFGTASQRYLSDFSKEIFTRRIAPCRLRLLVAGQWRRLRLLASPPACSNTF
jgi:hypothetical protein